MKDIKNVLSTTLISNYLSKIESLRDLPQTDISKVAATLAKAFFQKTDLQPIVEQNLPQLSASLIVTDIVSLLNCLQDSPDLGGHLPEPVAEFPTKTQKHSQDLDGLDKYLASGLKIKANNFFLPKIKELEGQIHSKTGEKPLFELLKAERVLTVNHFEDSRCMYIMHDLCDHLWLFNFLKQKGLFKKYDQFLSSLGDPINTNIFGKEAELIASIGFGARKFQIATKPILINLKDLQNLLSKAATKNQQEALSRINLLLSQEEDSKTLGKCIEFVISNMAIQIPDERRRWGNIKIRNQETGKIRNMSLLEPEYLAFMVESICLVYANKDQHRLFQLKASLIIEEILQELLKNHKQKFNLTLDKVINYDKKSFSDTKKRPWLENHLGFSTVYTYLNF